MTQNVGSLADVVDWMVVASHWHAVNLKDLCARCEFVAKQIQSVLYWEQSGAGQSRQTSEALPPTNWFSLCHM